MSGNDTVNELLHTAHTPATNPATAFRVTLKEPTHNTPTGRATHRTGTVEGEHEAHQSSTRHSTPYTQSQWSELSEQHCDMASDAA